MKDTACMSSHKLIVTCVGACECNCTTRPDDGNFIAAEKFQIAFANTKKIVGGGNVCSRSPGRIPMT